jgi:hypothetical protein
MTTATSIGALSALVVFMGGRLSLLLESPLSPGNRMPLTLQRGASADTPTLPLPSAKIGVQALGTRGDSGREWPLLQRDLQVTLPATLKKFHVSLNSEVSTTIP